jgi:hypothetical protein
VGESRRVVAGGFTIFAAIMMIVLGAFEAFQGLAAVLKQDYYVVTADYVYKFNVATWGWIHLILGIVVILAGMALVGGALWARMVGVVLAALVALANFLWLPYYPIWSVIIIATCVVVIWALIAHGRELAE